MRKTKKNKPKTAAEWAAAKELADTIAHERAVLLLKDSKRERQDRQINEESGNCYPLTLKKWFKEHDTYYGSGEFEKGLLYLEDTLRMLWETVDLMQRINRNVHHQIGWSTRTQAAKSLRLLLCAHSYWLLFRQDFLSVKGLIQSVISAGQHCNKTGRDNVRRSSHTKNPNAVDPTEFKVMTPDEKNIKKLAQLRNSWNSLCQVSRDMYSQYEDWATLPAYRDVKEVLPAFGKEAYSALLACQFGDIDKNRPDEHPLFGWKIGQAYTKYSNDSRQAMQVTTHLRFLIRCITDKQPAQAVKKQTWKGPDKDELGILRARVPSLEWGLEIFNRGVENKYYELPKEPETKPESWQRRMLAMRRTNNHCVMRQVMCHGSHVPQNIKPSFVLMCKQLPYRKRQIWMKMVAKIAGVSQITAKLNDDDKPTNEYEHSELPPWQNSVPTFLLGPPERVQGDDYMAPAMWVGREDRGRYNSEENRRYPNSPCYTTYEVGWIYLRRGWHDCYHAPGSERPTPEAVTTQIDLSTSHLRRQAGAVDPDANLTHKQRVAKILRQVRHIGVLTREDSYAVGNCRPGTEEFIRQLHARGGSVWNPETNVIDGKLIAKLWRKTEYHQLQLFGKVVKAMYEKLTAIHKAAEAKLELRLEQEAENEGMVLEKYRFVRNESRRVVTQFDRELEAMRRVADNIENWGQRSMSSFSVESQTATEELVLEEVRPLDAAIALRLSIEDVERVA